MRIKSPFACDVCGKQKGDAEGWWIGWWAHNAPIRENKKGVSLRSQAVMVIPWNEKMQDRPVKHLCSSRCVTAFIATELPEIIEYQIGSTKEFKLPKGKITGWVEVDTGVVCTCKKDSPDPKAHAEDCPIRIVAEAHISPPAPKPPAGGLAELIFTDDSGKDIGQP